jgi:hypothetical protein
MKRTLTLLVLLALGSLAASCSDSTGPENNTLLFQVTAVDPGQNPVPGLEATLHVPIPGFPYRRDAKPATSIQFAIPVSCVITMKIYNLDDDLLRTLHDGVLPAGTHRLVFDGRDDQGQQLLGTIVMRGHLEARDLDSSELLHEEWFYLVLYTGLDVEQRPSLGTTDSQGRIWTVERWRFPSLYDLPPLPLVDEAGDIYGTYSFGDAAEVRFADPQTGVHQAFQLTVADGVNRHRVVWNPPARLTPAGTAALPTALQHVPPPDEFSEVLVYPNPFN